MGIVRTRASLKGMRGSRDCIALVDTSIAMTVIDRSLAEEVGVTYTGRTSRWSAQQGISWRARLR